MIKYTSVTIVGGDIISIKLENEVELIVTYTQYKRLMNPNYDDEPLLVNDLITDTGVYEAVYKDIESTDDERELLGFELI